MIWFKENYRILAANPRMTLLEQGILWNMCRFAWDKQGITERDLPELSRSLREPLETIRYVWADFIATAEEVDGKWMLAEQRQGASDYKKHIELQKERGRKSAEKRALKTKDLQSTGGSTERSTGSQKQPQTAEIIPLKSLNKKDVLTETKDLRPTELDLDLERENTKKKHVAPVAATALVLELFSYWQNKLGHKDSILTKKRIAAIQGRLKEGYTPERIKRAIEGCALSPFHRGQNDRQIVYDDIELICRSGEKIEQFTRIADTTAKPTQRIFR